MTKHKSKVFQSFMVKYMTKIAQNKFDSVTLKNDLYVKWLVGYLVDECVPFKILHMGGGVTKIIKEGSCCPNCSGKGFFPLPDSTEKGMAVL